MKEALVKLVDASKARRARVWALIGKKNEGTVESSTVLQGAVGELHDSSSTRGKSREENFTGLVSLSRFLPCLQLFPTNPTPFSHLLLVLSLISLHFRLTLLLALPHRPRLTTDFTERLSLTLAVVHGNPQVHLDHLDFSYNIPVFMYHVRDKIIKERISSIPRHATFFCRVNLLFCFRLSQIK